MANDPIANSKNQHTLGFMIIRNPRVGDRLRVRGTFGIKHFGIFVGQRGPNGEDIVHNAKGSGVTWAYLEDFAGNENIFIDGEAKPGFQDLIASRAISLIGKGYALFTFNCEHFVTAVQEDKPKSDQLGTVLGFGGLLALVGAIWIGNSPTYDSNIGRYRDRNGRFA